MGTVLDGADGIGGVTWGVDSAYVCKFWGSMIGRKQIFKYNISL